MDAPDSEPTDYDETGLFRTFMVERFGFELPSTASPIMQTARQAAPDFQIFVKSRRP